METEQKAADYQAVLTDLEAKRDELDNAITVIKRLMGEPGIASTTGHHKQQTSHALTPTSFFGMSVGDAAKKYLATVKEPQTAPAIAKALENHGIKTVSKNFTVTVFSALERKEDAGEIVRPKRGLWGLTEWYPGLRPVKKENGEKNNSFESPKKNKSPSDKKQTAPATRDATPSSSIITVEAFEQFVREKPRRMKDVVSHFGTDKATVVKLLSPASKVQIVGVGWLKIPD
jgi:hypothetical protein